MKVHRKGEKKFITVEEDFGLLEDDFGLLEEFGEDFDEIEALCFWY